MEIWTSLLKIFFLIYYTLDRLHFSLLYCCDQEQEWRSEYNRWKSTKAIYQLKHLPPTLWTCPSEWNTGQASRDNEKRHLIVPETVPSLWILVFAWYLSKDYLNKRFYLLVKSHCEFMILICSINISFLFLTEAVQLLLSQLFFSVYRVEFLSCN